MRDAATDNESTTVKILKLAGSDEYNQEYKGFIYTGMTELVTAGCKICHLNTLVCILSSTGQQTSRCPLLQLFIHDAKPTHIFPQSSLLLFALVGT